ncbi:SRPBCC domain-containing protein [Streptomyces barringtoniae]|uniref:SRPBCC domain-containing protein n=1 Tax=Streptomyces barringtoniae TaxID=2892029 RepID=UPI001E2E4F55|nr:SRPBCC domain-containing protein [Streptomyces barringtoniae]MCC5474850.1 SRPBCC domain-containing protein [Streptomyces barringtoniae]
MYATRVSRRVQAPPHAVYRALTDADAIAAWRVPAGMTAQVHTFEAREGGTFRVSLTYDDASATGKSGGHTDTYSGRFARLVPDALVVEVFDFETEDDAVRGTMTMTTTLTAAAGGTDVEIVHEGIPDDIPREDNERGTRMALDNLARLVEGPHALRSPEAE